MDVSGRSLHAFQLSSWSKAVKTLRNSAVYPSATPPIEIEIESAYERTLTLFTELSGRLRWKHDEAVFFETTNAKRTSYIRDDAKDGGANGLCRSTRAYEMQGALSFTHRKGRHHSHKMMCSSAVLSNDDDSNDRCICVLQQCSVLL